MIKLRTDDGNTSYCFNNSIIISSGLLSDNRSRSFRWYSNIFSISYFKRRINSLPPLAINAGGCFVGFCVFHTTSYISWNEAIISHKISGDIYKNSDAYRDCNLLPYGHACFRLWHYIILYWLLNHFTCFSKTKITEIFFKKVIVPMPNYFFN